MPLIKTKAGISLFQILRLWGLFRVLKNSGRFNFNNVNQNFDKRSISIDEAYRILNLNPNKKYSKDVRFCMKCVFEYPGEDQEMYTSIIKAHINQQRKDNYG